MLFYVCVCRARDAVVLAEFKEVGGNADQVMQALTKRLVEIPEAIPPNSRKTFSQRNSDRGDFFGDLVVACTGGYLNMDGMEHFFHVWHNQGLLCACVSDDADSRGQEVNFQFLSSVEKDFFKEFSSIGIKMARKLGMQTKFLPNLRSKMHYYDINRVKLSREQKVQTLLNQVEDMRSVMDKNIRLMMEHQEGQLDDMIEKSDIMKQDAVVFKKKAEIILLASKRRLFIRNFSCTFFALGFIYLILALGCGFTFQACRV